MKITVVTVCFNSADTIADTIKSVAAQTFSPIEYIIVDGGSTDGTLDIIRQFGAVVTKLISGPDKGIYDAMNKGIQAATGDVIGFINADDFYAAHDVLRKVAQVFSEPAVDVCYGDLCYVRQQNTDSIVRYWRSSPFKLRSFEKGWCPPHPTFFVRKEVYAKLGSFDLNYRIAADVELMMRFLERHRLSACYIPEVLVKMRMGGTTNRSLSNVLKQNREILYALKTHGMKSSMARFLGFKLISRGLQFLVRPR